MRNFVVSDVFACTRVLKEANIKEKFKEIAKVTEGRDVREVGLEVFYTVFEAIASTKEGEALFYEFLAGPLEIEAAEIRKMPLKELIEKLKEIANLKEWLDFFREPLNIAMKN